MFYPANYGFIPNTLADDGDPLDALVVTPYPVMPGSIIRCRPVGVLNMEDEEGEDAKLVCVPHDKPLPPQGCEGCRRHPGAAQGADQALLRELQDTRGRQGVKVRNWDNAEGPARRLRESVKAAK